MLTLKSLDEIKQAGLDDIYEEVKSNIDNFYEEHKEISGLNIDEEARQHYYQNLVDFGGGAVCVVERYEDLKEISVIAGIDADGHIVSWLDESSVRDANIIETASDFDAADYVCDGKFALLLICTNNGGGDVYYIPRLIADMCPNIDISIKRHLGEIQDDSNQED
jgi:hypothetical protein